ncbi:MAG: triose-phosphate isomerase [Desulfonauticus sp.]|nr:triose-phosphate isomerase [Desulfonauticus sp.]
MKQLIAANWKMHKTWEESIQTAREIVVGTYNQLPANREVLIIPSFPHLKAVSDVLAKQKNYFLGAQNLYPALKGAFTGEVSPAQLLDVGCSYVLVGHSERRHVLQEQDEFLAQKASFALEQGLKVIFCIGETIEQRQQGRTKEVLRSQLELGLKDVQKVDSEDLVIAYEPVWAIGTGQVAQEQDILDAHAFIREFLQKTFSGAEEVRILYGGSVKPANASSILALDNVDGVLVGGASLTAESFNQIILA